MNIKVLAAMVLVASGCSSVHPRHDQLGENTPGDAESFQIPADAKITLERHECYGSCPVYTVTIGSDGTVVFDGVADVKMLGRHESHIGPEQVAFLLRLARYVRFFDLDGDYSQGSVDAPMSVISITADGETKTVRDRWSVTMGMYVLSADEHEHLMLEWFASYVDGVAGTAEWIAGSR